MTITKTCEPGAVVTIPFNFSNRRGIKIRPAIVISTDEYHTETADVILMALTSQSNVQGPKDYSLTDWNGAGLNKPSKTKPLISSFERRSIIKRVGTLVRADWLNVQAAVRDILEI